MASDLCFVEELWRVHPFAQRIRFVPDADCATYERVQYRFPRSRRRRIRKKWALDPKNWRLVRRLNAFRLGELLVVPESMRAQLFPEVTDGE